MTFTRSLSTNNYGPAKFIVDGTTVANGTHSTIQAAITSASSGDTIAIRPGTYVENLTLKAGVNLTAYVCDSSLNGTGHVIISGTCTMTTAGSVTISGIQLQTNSVELLAVTGSAASVVNLVNCFLNMTNFKGITYSSSSASSLVSLKDCRGNLGTTGIEVFVHSSAGTLLFDNCTFTNSGGSSNANTVSAGLLFMRWSAFANPLTTSGTSGLIIEWTAIDTSTQNVTSLTHGGSVTGVSFHNFYKSGTASAVTIDTGTLLGMDFDNVVSTNTNAITGLGSLRIGAISFGSSSLINTTTIQSAGVFRSNQYAGRAVNTAPSAGMLGERLTASLSFAARTSLTTATAKTIISVSLTPGIWDVYGMISFVPNPTTSITQYAISISPTDNTTTGNFGDDQLNDNYTTAVIAFGPTLTLPAVRVSLSATTTYYLVGVATFTVSLMSAYGTIRATRVA